MSDWLRGSARDAAVSFGDDVVDYGDLKRRVGAAVLPPGDGVVGCPAGTEPVELLTTVLACIDRGRPVAVGATQREADRLRGALPTGTEIALLTSGSSSPSGTPRIVARTNASWLDSAAPLAELAGLSRADRVAVTGPLHVSMHLFAALHALRLGATVGDTIEGATVVHATPTRFARILDGPSAPDAAVVAGAAMSPSLRARAAARGIRVTEYYGAAELSFVAASHGGDLAPFPGVEVSLRPDAAGLEVWARSPYLALGVVGGGMFRRDADGFGTVGDLADTGGDGGFRILGRGDAAITTAGATVLVEHVEACIEALPGVSAVAVVGEPHELLGERVVAVVELDGAAQLDEVVAAARGVLGTVELPRRWIVRPLPRTASGKVARGVLREELDAEAGVDGAFESGRRAAWEPGTATVGADTLGAGHPPAAAERTAS